MRLRFFSFDALCSQKHIDLTYPTEFYLIVAQFFSWSKVKRPLKAELTNLIITLTIDSFFFSISILILSDRSPRKQKWNMY